MPTPLPALPEAKPIDTYNFEVPAVVVLTVQATSPEEARKIAEERCRGGRFLGTIAEGCVVHAVNGGRLYMTAFNGDPI